MDLDDVGFGYLSDEPVLDEQVNYVLTLRMRPTRVTLRLVQRAGDPQAWVLVRRATR